MAAPAHLHIHSTEMERKSNVTTVHQPLSGLKEGQSARVTGLRATGGMRRRLQDLGVVEGTQIDCLQKSPSGDPVAYYIRGAIIALRAEDSDKILVGPVLT